MTVRRYLLMSVVRGVLPIAAALAMVYAASGWEGTRAFLAFAFFHG